MSAAPADAATMAIASEHDSRNLKRRSVHGAAATLVSQGLRFVLQFGSQVALAHLLLPTDFGLIAMIAPVLSFIQIFNDLGLSQATIQRPQISQGELTALFWINVAVSATLAVAMAAAAPLVAAFYNEPRLIPICMAIASLLFISGLASQQVALLNRYMKFKVLATMDVACAVAAVVVGVAAAMAGLGYWSLVLMQAATSLTVVVVAWSNTGWRPSWPGRQTGVGSMLRFGGHLTLFNLISFAGTNCDSILIGKVGGSMALGLYDRAFKLVAAPIWQMSLPVDRVAISLLSRLHAEDDRYRRAFVQMLQVLLLATVPAVVFVATTADVLVPLVLGQTWTAAGPIVSALAVATGFVPFSICSYWLFVSQGRSGAQLRWAWARSGLSLVALLCGLHWGALGVARSYALSAVLVHGTLLWGATRHGPVTLPVALRASYPIILAGCVAAVGLQVFERNLPASAQLASVLRLLIEGGLAYLLCAACLLCWPDGLRILDSLWRLRSTFARVKTAG